MVLKPQGGKFGIPSSPLGRDFAKWTKDTIDAA